MAEDRFIVRLLLSPTSATMTSVWLLKSWRCAGSYITTVLLCRGNV